MPIEAVGFDLDYTLAVPDRSRAQILADATDRAGASELRGTLTREAYLRAHRREHVAETREGVFAAMLDDGSPGRRETGADPDAGAGNSHVDPADLARAYREEIAAALRPVEGVEDLLDDLDGRYRVGLLTNGPSVAQRDKLRELGWTDRFDAVVITGDLGHAKPDRRAFEALCRELDADPGETVYVGDDPEADVGGAADAGLHTVQVLGDDEFTPEDPDPRADAVVRRDRLAADLPGILRDLDG